MLETALKTKCINIDMPYVNGTVEVDDFIVAIGKCKSNSVYHVVKVKRVVPSHGGRVNRYYLDVVNSDLLTALRRESCQRLIPMKWRPRKKKKNDTI